MPMIKLLHGHYPLIFHSHFETFDLSPLLLKSFLYRDAKVVWQFHSIAQLTRQQRIKDMIKVGIIARRFADLFVAVGDNVYDNILQRGFPGERVCLNRNGIDIEKFCTKGGIAPRGALADGSTQGVSFLLLGYDPVIKGVDLFIKAAARLCEDGHRNRRFLIVARKETRDFVLGMPEASLLKNGFEIIDPVEDFGKLLAQTDVLVVASRTEGLSYAALEALAAGRLVISSELPGVRETYGKSDGVWLFPVEGWEHLAELMRMVEGLSPGERERLGKANSAYATAHHSLDGWAKRTIECYRRVLNSLPAV
jgi:glycosyltransferase involved in cell wall biosynthesis